MIPRRALRQLSARNSPRPAICPLLRASRRRADVAATTAPDPDVWSGRASQEGFVETAAYGLASMYLASRWSSCSGPSWISARVRGRVIPCSFARGWSERHRRRVMAPYSYLPHLRRRLAGLMSRRSPATKDSVRARPKIDVDVVQIAHDILVCAEGRYDQRYPRC